MTGGDRPRVVLALTPIAERSVEQLLFGAEAPLELVGSASEADELDRLAEGAAGAAVLISPQLPGLSAGHCARLRAAGLRVVGLALDDHDRQQLEQLGADATIEVDATADQLRDAMTVTADPVGAAGVAGDAGERRRDDDARAVLAVVGSKGAPGATECAASLAALASDRWPVLLLEVDALGGDLDVRIAADPAEGSILGLVRALRGDGSAELDDLLARWTVAARGWPAVLLGPAPVNGAMSELARPGSVASALDAVGRRWPAVVCDVGFALGEQHDIAPRVHREALVHADAVLLVIGARETQLRHGLLQLDVLLDDLAIGRERLRVAVNGLGAPGTPDRATVEQTIAAELAERRLAADAWLEWDARGLRRAQHLALPLARAHPRGTYARVLGRLLESLFVAAIDPSDNPRTEPLAPGSSAPAAAHMQETA